VRDRVGIAIVGLMFAGMAIVAGVAATRTLGSARELAAFLIALLVISWALNSSNRREGRDQSRTYDHPRWVPWVIGFGGALSAQFVAASRGGVFVFLGAIVSVGGFMAIWAWRTLRDPDV
jgi:hypothetical protein